MEDEILKDVERAKKFDEGIPSDIHEEIAPFVKSGSLDLSCAKNEKLKRMIKLVREKLMP